MRAALAVVVLLLVGGCDRGPSASSEPHQPSAKTARPPSRNRALGAAEPREPEPFTIEQRLLDAVRRGDRATVERALAHGATVGTRDDLGRSTVLLATMDAGDLELVRWLHARGASLDDPDVGGRTALSFAAADGRLDIVRYLVENGAVVERRDVQGRTALFHAALGGHREVLAFLLDRQAGIDTRDQFGDTPLIVACAKGHAAAAALLLERGADASLTDQEGRTAKERSAAEASPCRGPGGP